jgi:hypothetical protein
MNSLISIRPLPSGLYRATNDRGEVVCTGSYMECDLQLTSLRIASIQGTAPFLDAVHAELHKMPCKACDGGAREYVCAHCVGTGTDSHAPVGQGMCRHCQGTGQRRIKCSICEGTGRVGPERALELVAECDQSEVSEAAERIADRKGAQVAP